MDMRRHAPRGHTATHACAGTHGHVLVVEDNRVHRMIASAILQAWDIGVTLTHDGQEAVRFVTQSAASERPDLVLMDLRMPVMDGYAATQRIREWEAQTGRNGSRVHLPIIALTADAFEHDRQRCLAAGMDDVVTKPVDRKLLRAVLDSWLVPDINRLARPTQTTGQ